MDDRRCRGCDARITPGQRERNPRRWCSEACRVRTHRYGSGLAPQLTCVICGSNFEGRRGAKYCSPRCRSTAQSRRRKAGRSPERLTCILCGETFSRRPTRGQKPKYCDVCQFGDDPRCPRFRILCKWCGGQGEATKPDRQFCSPACAHSYRSFQARNRRLPILHPDPPTLTNLPLAHPARTPVEHPALPGTVFVSGPCDWCGDEFMQIAPTFDTRSLTCSDRCRKARARHRSRTARGRFSPSPKQRLRIYERDNWICQLCDEPVDRDAHYLDDWAPTLDHIIPQSHVLVPDHSDSNLRLAHRWCNAVRGDETHYTAADLAS